MREGTVIPAIPLVLDENRRFQEEGQRRLVRYYLHAGVGGVAVAVHTTQFEIRKPGIDLLRPVLTVTAQEMERFERETGKTLVRVAGVCGPVEQAVSEAEMARELGYDAVLLSPGGLAEYLDEYLVDCFVDQNLSQQGYWALKSFFQHIAFEKPISPVIASQSTPMFASNYSDFLAANVF